jgi:two-component system, sensor histidine kinase YesM
MFSSIKENISAIPLGKKILIGFSIVIVFNLLLLLLVFNFNTKRLKDLAVQNSQISMRIASQGIAAILNDSLNLTHSLNESSAINDLLSQDIFTEGMKEKLEKEGQDALYYISKYYEDIFGVHIIGINGLNFHSNSWNTKNYFSESYWFNHLLRLSEPSWHICEIGSIAAETSIIPLLYLSIPFVDESGNQVGLIITEIELNRLKKIIYESLQGLGTLYLFNEELTISPEYKSYVAEDPYLERVNNILLDKSMKVCEEKDILLITDNIDTPNWEIAGLIDKKQLFKESNMLLVITMIVFGLILFVSTIFAVIISRTVTTPIAKLKSLMKQVENGNLQVKMNIESRDEIGELGKSFNVMIKRLKFLMSSIYDDQIKLRKAELIALQSQIKPHFLYNTLESINWLARYKKNDEIIKMVTALTTLFRTTINRGENIALISEEISHVKSYLIIQQMRYLNAFEFEIDVPEEILSCYTIKLLLQPIVENAIYHGVKMQDKRGLIQIRAKSETDSIFFEVIDNGPGMPSSRVDQFNRKIHNEIDQTESGGYGLKNVEDRIRVFFGKAYGLYFMSNEGEGTVVKIHIPKRKDKRIYDSRFTY